MLALQLLGSCTIPLEHSFGIAQCTLAMMNAEAYPFH